MRLHLALLARNLYKIDGLSVHDVARVIGRPFEATIRILVSVRTRFRGAAPS